MLHPGLGLGLVLGLELVEAKVKLVSSRVGHMFRDSCLFRDML